MYLADRRHPVVHDFNNILKSRANPAPLYSGCVATGLGVMSG